MVHLLCHNNITGNAIIHSESKSVQKRFIKFEEQSHFQRNVSKQPTKNIHTTNAQEADADKSTLQAVIAKWQHNDVALVFKRILHVDAG